MPTRLPLAERRAQLVDAALAVAADEGIGAATVRRVAERAGVALGLVHYCFRDKDELVAAVAERIVADLGAAASSAVGVDGGSPDTDIGSMLVRAVVATWQLVEATANEQLLTYEITVHALRTPELRDVAARQYAASQAAVEQLLFAAADTAGVEWSRPVAEVAADVLAVLDGVTLRWLVDRDGDAARARLENFARYVAASTRRVARRRKVGA